MTNKAEPQIPSSGDLQQQAHLFVTDSAIWVQNHWLNIVVASGIAIVIFIVLHMIRRWGMALCKRGEGVTTWYAILGRALGKTSHFFILMTSIRLVSGYAGAPPTLAATIQFLFTVSAVFQAAIWVRELIFGVVEQRTLAENQNVALSSALGIIRILVSILLFAIALVVVLSNLGVNVTGLVAGLGIGGIAIGLAAQGIFADLFAALAILFDRPFRLGDSISYDKGAGSGTVEAIGLKSTRIRGGNGEERIVANKKLLDFEILNTTRRHHNRFKYDFHLGYATDPDLIERIPAMLKDAVESEGYKLVHGGLNGFGSSGLSYDVEFESTDVDFPAEARDKVAAAILRRFRDAGISFAYPTQLTLVAEKTKPIPPAQPEPE
jgi:small-conductance mechanosensitive channel